jgi:hypothetical protein
MEVKINYDKELKIASKLDFPMWVEFFINKTYPDFETFYIATNDGVCLLDSEGTVIKEYVKPRIFNCNGEYRLSINDVVLTECNYGKFWCFQRDVKVKKYYKGITNE